ncbi:MAG: gliding motility-associated C-terminal domain-containing protein [Bacteroidales bacterium]|nr:gliding motility-associated C-terminal domain-containing protein [Bacteroidales bacterium]
MIISLAHYLNIKKLNYWFVLIFIFFPFILPAQQVYINEVLVNPVPNPQDYCSDPGVNANSLYNVDNAYLPSYNREYIELYNPHPCDSVDISCYTLGCNMSSALNGSNWGAFTFPPGTKIPPAGFLVIGGNDTQSPTLDFNLTYYRDNYFNNQYLCGDFTRWFLRDEWGWVALYDPQGTPVDAIYWNAYGSAQSLYVEDEYQNPVVSTTTCAGTKTFAAAANISGIAYVGHCTPGTFLSFQRIIDGSQLWFPTTQTPTPGGCNGPCVKPAAVSLQVIDAYCNQGNGTIVANIISGGTGPYTIVWDGNAVLSSDTLKNISAGMHYITVTDAYNCFVTVDSAMVDNIPGPDVVSGDQVNENCSDANGWATVSITGGTPPFTVLWNTVPPQNNDTAFYLAAGTYIATVNDSKGCVAATTVTITNHKEPSLSFDILSADTCNMLTGSAMVTATNDYPPYTYQWNTVPVQTAATATSLNTGVHTVTVSDGVCSVTGQVTIPAVPGPTAEFTAAPWTVYVEDGLVNFTDLSSGNPVKWYWDFGDGNMAVNQNPVNHYSALGTYPVTLYITDNIGCKDSVTHDILVKDITSIFFPNAFSPNNDGKNDRFKPAGVYITQYKLFIFDRWGSTLYYSEDPEVGWDGTFNGKPVSNGVYAYKCVFEHDYGENVVRELQLYGTVTLVR